MATRKIQGITIEFGADGTQLIKNISEIKNKMSGLNTVLSKTDALLKFDPKNIELLTQKQSQLQTQIKNSKDKLKELNNLLKDFENDGVEETDEKFQALRREIIKNEQELEKLEDRLKTTNEQLNIQTNPFSKLGDKLQETGDKVKGIGTKISDVGDSFVKNGAIMSAAITAPLTIIGKQSFTAFRDFESALAGVGKTTEMSGEKLKEFGRQAQDMSNELPFSAVEILNVAEAAGQLGIKEDNLLSFSETMLRLGQSTNMTSEQAAIDIAQFSNVIGMSQSDVDRFGATVVDLGNNYATTEAEIVSMATKLAGAGKVVGLTSQETLALSTILSELRISAELGGTNMSKAMQQMNNAVIEGGNQLERFAEISGVSAEEFATKFREKPVEAIALFIDGLDKLNQSGGNSVKALNDVGITAQREVDIFQRLMGNTDKLRGAVNDANGAWEDNTALMVESEKRNETTASKMQTLKNRFEDVRVQLGEALLPVIEKLVPVIEKAVDWFSNLSPEAKETAVQIGALAAAIGPVTTIFGTFLKPIGGVVKGFGSLITGGGKVASAIGKISGTTVATTGSVAGFGTKLAGIAKFAMNPWVAGAAAMVAGGVAINKYMSKDSIEAMDIFSEGVSESTKEALGGFLELEENATKSLNELVWSGQTVTSEGVTGITTNISMMTKTLSDGIQEQRQQAQDNMVEMMANAKDLTETEKQNMIDSVNSLYDERQISVQEGEARINAILVQASTHKRTLTQEEVDEINAIKNGMKEEGVRVLTESEAEYKVIMQRMKDNSSEMSALQAAAVVQNSLKQKDETIANAENEYAERIKYAEQIRAQGGQKAEETADKIIEEAKKQRDEAVRQAEDMHNNVVTEAQKQAEGHVKEVDWETGEVKSKWQVLGTNIADTTSNLYKDIKDWVSKTGEKLSTGWDKIKETAKDKWDALGENIMRPITAAKSWLDDKVSAFKNAFNFEWRLPRFKLPRISVSTSEGIFGIPIPKFHVEWNREGGIFKKPTLLADIYGGLQGVAEPSTGGEAILPLNKLPQLMAEALEKSKVTQEQTIITYVTLDGKVIAKEVTENVNKNLNRQSTRTRMAGGLA